MAAVEKDIKSPPNYLHYQQKSYFPQNRQSPDSYKKMMKAHTLQSPQHRQQPKTSQIKSPLHSGQGMNGEIMKPPIIYFQNWFNYDFLIDRRVVYKNFLRRKIKNVCSKSAEEEKKYITTSWVKQANNRNRRTINCSSQPEKEKNFHRGSSFTGKRKIVPNVLWSCTI